MTTAVPLTGSYEGCAYEFCVSGEGPFLGRFSIVRCNAGSCPGEWHTSRIERTTREQAHEDAERAARGVIDTLLYQSAVQDCRVASQELQAAQEQAQGMLRAELKLQALNERRVELLRRLQRDPSRA